MPSFLYPVLSLVLLGGPHLKEATMTIRATGAFGVKVAPLKGDEEAWGGFGRPSIDKQFRGDLEGTSRGQMMAWGSGAGPGAYVALEKVTGTLKGRSGTFVLMHEGTMGEGAPTLRIRVAPGSGTGQLAGIQGSLEIRIDQGRHTYVFEATLP